LAFGILLLDKPSGPTSHDMVMAVRRGTGEKQVGHAGTLDPLATGLLVICLGAATRLSDYLRDKDKRYRARVRLGQSTNTYDAGGEITSESAVIPDRSAVEEALVKFRGSIQQRPPAFSAVKRGGQKAYELARAGRPVELEARPVEIYALELLEWQPPELTLEILCSSGTYIRSLAHDLGDSLGCGAHLTALRRTASGNFRVSEAVTLDELTRSFERGDWRSHLRPADQAVADWPEVGLTAEAAARIQHGQSIPLEEYADDYARAYNPGGEFIALLRADTLAGLWRPYKVLLPPPTNSDSKS
jgi:tRNA pseudouridine55 synthase